MIGEHDSAAATREARDSVFLHAVVTAVDGSASGLFRVRNISSGGLMVEGPIDFARGEEVDVDLRNIGRVHATVAWNENGRCGVIFDHKIDPREARKPVGGGGGAVSPAPRPSLGTPFPRRQGPYPA